MLNKLKMRLRRKLLDITQTKAHEVHAPSDLMPTVMAAVAKKRLDAARKTCGEAVHHAIKVVGTFCGCLLCSGPLSVYCFLFHSGGSNLKPSLKFSDRPPVRPSFAIA